jgi:hypothetical protein
VLACNEATDVASLARRAQLADELLASVATVGFGRLVLCAAERASPKLRHELLSLAHALGHAGRGAASVTVRFKEATED